MTSIAIQTSDLSEEDNQTADKTPRRQFSWDTKINSSVTVSKHNGENLAYSPKKSERSSERRSKHRDGNYSPSRHKNGHMSEVVKKDSCSMTDVRDGRTMNFDSSLGDGLIESPMNSPRKQSPVRMNSPMRHSPVRMSSVENSVKGSPRKYGPISPVRMSSMDSSVKDSPRKHGPVSPSRMESVEYSYQDNRVYSDPAAKYQILIKEFESSTIEKQRRELQDLIQELKERDRELNEMVTSHQQQMIGWEQDRSRLMHVEEQAARLEASIQQKNDQVRNLLTKIKVMESEDQAKLAEIEDTHRQLAQLSQQQNQDSGAIKDLQEKNNNLTTALKEISTKLKTSESRVKDLEDMLKSKEKDFTESKSLISELSARAKKLEKKTQEFRNNDANVKKQLVEVTQRFSESQKIQSKEKEESSYIKRDNDNLRKEVESLKAQVKEYKVQFEIFNEREKRKDDLILSQRSKQERTDAELTSIRQLYERQQKNLTSLQENLDKSQDMLKGLSQSVVPDDAFAGIIMEPLQLTESYNQDLLQSTAYCSPRPDMDTMVDIHLKVGPLPSTPTKITASLPNTPRGNPATTLNMSVESPRFSRYQNTNNSARYPTDDEYESDLSFDNCCDHEEPAQFAVMDNNNEDLNDISKLYNNAIPLPKNVVAVENSKDEINDITIVEWENDLL